VTPTRWRQFEGLYEAARACSPSGRAELLARSDHDVRLVVQQMLDQPSEGSPLDNPAWEQTPTTSLLEPPIGSQLGPYRIDALLGAGGMGMVFRAVDTRLDRAVAVKVSSGQFSKRFEREARAISALIHPNVCTLYDVGSLPSGAAYMVTELVEGETLREWMKRSPDLDRSLGVIHQVIEGLSAAHRAGIVHRDLKPANIIVRVDGYVKVLDFGLAKRITSEDGLNSGELSAPGRIMGTAAYMSPEQITGWDADPRTDLFALGIILYEAVAGSHPWSGGGRSTVDIMHAILHDDPPPTQAPWALDRVVRRCLEKRAADRFQSAGELDKALRQAVADASPGAKLAQCSIAVLPFTNIGVDKENEYFGNGLAEEVINELASVPGFKVAARTSSFFFKGKHLEVEEIGKRLQAIRLATQTNRPTG